MLTQPSPAENYKEPDTTFRGTAKVLSFFSQEAGESLEKRLSVAPEIGQSFDLQDSSNRSLLLAQRSDFYKMCERSLYGSEDEQRFGELLRALVIRFKPTDEFDLHRLADIADLEWQLHRAVKFRQGLFLSIGKSKTAEGMSLGVEKAFEHNETSDVLRKSLQQAISLYYSCKEKR